MPGLLGLTLLKPGLYLLGSEQDTGTDSESETAGLLAAKPLLVDGMLGDAEILRQVRDGKQPVGLIEDGL